jgi:hypothetical protein
MFSFLKSFYIVFQNGCTSLHSHQQCMRVPFSPHPRQHFLLMVHLMLAILTRVRWNLSVVLTCISFRARDGEHFFLVIWISSLEKVLLSSVAYFFFGHWFLRSLVFWALYIFWLSVLWCIASKYFLPLCGWSLQFRDHFFCCAETF